MIRKIKSGYRLYSRKKNPKTGKRRNLGTFKTLAAAKKHERAVQFFKRKYPVRGSTASPLFCVGLWAPAAPQPCEGGLSVGRFLFVKHPSSHRFRPRRDLEYFSRSRRDWRHVYVRSEYIPRRSAGVLVSRGHADLRGRARFCRGCC